MKIDIYTKSILTLIALCLVILVVQNSGIVSPAFADGPGYDVSSLGTVPLNEDGSINVRVTDFSPNELVDVNIKDISTYDELKVEVSDISTTDEMRVNIYNIDADDQLNVNIEEVNGSTIGYDGIPVKVND